MTVAPHKQPDCFRFQFPPFSSSLCVPRTRPSASQPDSCRLITGQCVAFVFTYVYTKLMKFAGFNWDSGNWPKCGKHGVSREEIEEVLLGAPAVLVDPHPDETRMRAIGKTTAGRYVFLAFMVREIDSETKIRPISARYMHSKEIDHYESKS